MLALLGIVALALVWEGYKAFGEAVDGHVLGWKLPLRYDDSSMPHVSTVLRRFT